MPAASHAANTSFRGFGRAATGKDGAFAFTTVKPGAVPGPDGRPQAPHINVGVFARGMLKRLFTRIYLRRRARQCKRCDSCARVG